MASEDVKKVENDENVINLKRTDYISWDTYFMATARLSAMRSKDPVTQVGACIVDKENRIIAIGYNGMPRKCHDDVFPWSKLKDLGPYATMYDCKKMYVVHAEANAILNRNSLSITGTTIYTTLFPCNECAKLIIQCGITEVCYLSDKYAEKPSYKASKRMFDAAGIKYRQHVPEDEIIVSFNDTIKEDPNTTA